MGGDRHLLGIDVGTSRTKALVLGRSGSEVAVADVPTPFAGGEMTVDALASSLCALLSALGPGRAVVAAVGIAGMAESGAPLDAEGTPLAPVIAWHDRRGAGVAEVLRGRFGDALATRTGQRPRTVSSVAKLGWLVAEGCGGIRRWLGVPELCLRMLTGAEATEHSLASRTGCYDVTERRFLPEVAAAAGIDPAVFPPVVPAGSVAGRVNPGAAGWSGLRDGTPVTLAGHDHLAGAAGAGAREDDLGNSVGTTETVLRTMPRPPDMAAALAHRVAVSVRPGGRGWVALAGAARSGIVLSAAAAALGLPAAALDRLAEESVPVEVSGIVEALQAGEAARLPEVPPGAVWRGLLEALSARTAEAAARLGLVGGPGSRVLAFGGGARSEVWLRAKARRLELPLARARTAEAAARGAAVWAGVAAGWWPSPDAAPPPPHEAVDA